VKAIYQKYIGWYDANPANLDPLPPEESGKKFVEYMGGADAILDKARADFAKGEYRFIAQALSHLVFAEPDNKPARALLADAFEQLGYLAESSTWRNAYLFGAQELRQGMLKTRARSSFPSETLNALSTAQIWDLLGIRLNGPKAEGKRIVINWRFDDIAENYILNLENSALTYVEAAQAPSADASCSLDRSMFTRVVAGETSFAEGVANGAIAVTGDAGKIVEVLALLDEFPRVFEIVEPKRRHKS
jgi:alkyl sulfatase BDS1-like metallo-beta-lactamase superfamily hydrolase